MYKTDMLEAVLILYGIYCYVCCCMWSSDKVSQSQLCLFSKVEETKIWNHKLGNIHLRGMKKIIYGKAIVGIHDLKIEEVKNCGEC